MPAWAVVSLEYFASPRAVSALLSVLRLFRGKKYLFFILIIRGSTLNNGIMNWLLLKLIPYLGIGITKEERDCCSDLCYNTYLFTYLLLRSAAL